MEHLQRRLAVDAGRPRIRIAITELLLRSYYPQQQQSSGSSLANNQNQVLRCLRFVQENLPASIAFSSWFNFMFSFLSINQWWHQNLELL